MIFHYGKTLSRKFLRPPCWLTLPRKFLHPPHSASLADFLNGFHKLPRPAVGQIVAGDARDDDVLQPECAGRLGHAARLVHLGRQGLSLWHAAKAARPGACVAQDQKRGRLLRIALHTVRTFGMVTDRMQPQLADQLRREVVGVSLRHVPLQPARERRGIRDWGLGIGGWHIHVFYPIPAFWPTGGPVGK